MGLYGIHDKQFSLFFDRDSISVWIPILCWSAIDYNTFSSYYNSNDLKSYHCLWWMHGSALGQGSYSTSMAKYSDNRRIKGWDFRSYGIISSSGLSIQDLVHCIGNFSSCPQSCHTPHRIGFLSEEIENHWWKNKLIYYECLWAALTESIMAIALLISGIHMIFAGITKKLVKHIQVVKTI